MTMTLAVAFGLFVIYQIGEDRFDWLIAFFAIAYVSSGNSNVLGAMFPVIIVALNLGLWVTDPRGKLPALHL